MNSVFIKELRLYARHGVMPQEQKVGAYFIVDVEIETDFRRAMETDELEGTISYADMLEVIKREMATPSKLLEHVAGRTVKALFAAFPQAQSVRLSITKENPPMGADCKGAGVVVHETR